MTERESKIIKFVDSSGNAFEFTNGVINQEIIEFLEAQRKRIQKAIWQAEAEPVSYLASHNRRKNSREMMDARKAKRNRINALERELDALREESVTPIKLVEGEDGKLTYEILSLITSD